MSILCYVTFNERGSVLKSVFGEWGPMFSPESPGLAQSAASQWGPRPPVRAQQQQPQQQRTTPPPSTENPTKKPPCAPPPSSTTTCSSNLFKQIKSTLLLHLTFIWRATPPRSLCVSPSLRRAARFKSGPDRTKQSQPRPQKFPIKFFMNRLQLDYQYIL